MFVSGVKCITRLDVSENNLDVELASVVNGVTRNRHLQSLNISKNLPKIKARDVGHVMDAIVQLVRAPNYRERASAARSWREPAGEKLGWSKGGWRSQPPASWRRAGARLAGGASRLPAAAQQPTSFCFCYDDRSGEIYSTLNKLLNVSDTDFVKAPQSISEKCSTEY